MEISSLVSSYAAQIFPTTATDADTEQKKTTTTQSGASEGDTVSISDEAKSLLASISQRMTSPNASGGESAGGSSGSSSGSSSSSSSSSSVDQQIQQLQSQLQNIMVSSLPDDVKMAQAAPIQQQIALLQSQKQTGA